MKKIVCIILILCLCLSCCACGAGGYGVKTVLTLVEQEYSLAFRNDDGIYFYVTAAIEQLSEEVRLHDPRMALDGKEDGLYFYRKIIGESGRYLNPGGWLMFEIGSDQADAVVKMLREKLFTGVRVIRDLAGLDRVVVGRKIEMEESHV